MDNPIHIGTSGWSYRHWDEIFYKNVKSNERLLFYSNHFKTVEINTTFYHLPLETTVKRWHEEVPSDFIFSVKASRFITHIKRLIECKEPLKLFFSRIKLLKGKLGPILFQLPPSFQADFERLEAFLKLLSPKYHYVFEFRHASWYVKQTYGLLRKYNVALCITDLKGKTSPLVVTADFVYLRLHGPKLAYKGSYGPRRLAIWKRRLHKEFQKEAFVYFDNDEKSFAVKDGKLLQTLVDK